MFILWRCFVPILCARQSQGTRKQLLHLPVVRCRYPKRPTQISGRRHAPKINVFLLCGLMAGIPFIRLPWESALNCAYAYNDVPGNHGLLCIGLAVSLWLNGVNVRDHYEGCADRFNGHRSLIDAFDTQTVAHTESCERQQRRTIALILDGQ